MPGGITLTPADILARKTAAKKKTAAAQASVPGSFNPKAKITTGTPGTDYSPTGGNGAATLVASYKAFQKANPGKGQSAFMKWFNAQTGGGGGATPPSSWDPLAGMPSQEALTAFPTLGTLPDGSEIPDAAPHAFKPGQAQLLDPNKYASSAQKAYQPIIDALTNQGNRMTAGVADANSMLDSRYGASKQAALAGAQTISDTNAKSNQSLTDLAARLAGVAGGDPTAAAAVGQATANQIGADKRMTDIGVQTQADQAAAADRDLASQKLGYKSATDSAVADLTSKAASAKTEASQARDKALEEALGFNSSQQTSQVSRDTAKQEAWLAGQLAGPQITAGKLANEGSRQSLKLNAHTAAVNDWTTLNGAKQTQYMNAVTKWTNKNVANQMKDALATGKTPGAEIGLADPQARAQIEQDIMGPMLTKSGPAVNPGSMYHQALDSMKRTYPDSNPAAIKKLAGIFVSKQLGIWNSGHAKGQTNSGKTWKMTDGGPVLVKA